MLRDTNTYAEYVPTNEKIYVSSIPYFQNDARAYQKRPVVNDVVRQTRARFIRDLETTKVPQMFGKWKYTRDGVIRLCAMGIFYYVTCEMKSRRFREDDAVKLLGITYGRLNDIEQWNDDLFTFPEIAAKLRRAWNI